MGNIVEPRLAADQFGAIAGIEPSFYYRTRHGDTEYIQARAHWIRGGDVWIGAARGLLWRLRVAMAAGPAHAAGIHPRRLRLGRAAVRRRYRPLLQVPRTGGSVVADLRSRGVLAVAPCSACGGGDRQPWHLARILRSSRGDGRRFSPMVRRSRASPSAHRPPGIRSMLSGVRRLALCLCGFYRRHDSSLAAAAAGAGLYHRGGSYARGTCPGIQSDAATGCASRGLDDDPVRSASASAQLVGIAASRMGSDIPY